MSRSLSQRDFNLLVKRYCQIDGEFRHEIEREEYYGAFQYSCLAAYHLFCSNQLSLREAFGLTERRRLI
jgi:hypothetical protein